MTNQLRVGFVNSTTGVYSKYTSYDESKKDNNEFVYYDAESDEALQIDVTRFAELKLNLADDWKPAYDIENPAIYSISIIGDIVSKTRSVDSDDAVIFEAGKSYIFSISDTITSMTIGGSTTGDIYFYSVDMRDTSSKNAVFKGNIQKGLKQIIGGDSIEVTYDVEPDIPDNKNKIRIKIFDDATGSEVEQSEYGVFDDTQRFAIFSIVSYPNNIIGDSSTAIIYNVTKEEDGLYIEVEEGTDIYLYRDKGAKNNIPEQDKETYKLYKQMLEFVGTDEKGIYVTDLGFEYDESRTPIKLDIKDDVVTITLHKAPIFKLDSDLNPFGNRDNITIKVIAWDEDTDDILTEEFKVYNLKEILNRYITTAADSLLFSDERKNIRCELVIITKTEYEENIRNIVVSGISSKLSAWQTLSFNYAGSIKRLIVFKDGDEIIQLPRPDDTKKYLLGVVGSNRLYYEDSTKITNNSGNELLYESKKEHKYTATVDSGYGIYATSDASYAYTAGYSDSAKLGGPVRTNTDLPITYVGNKTPYWRYDEDAIIYMINLEGYSDINKLNSTFIVDRDFVRKNVEIEIPVKKCNEVFVIVEDDYSPPSYGSYLKSFTAWCKNNTEFMQWSTSDINQPLLEKGETYRLLIGAIVLEKNNGDDITSTVSIGGFSGNTISGSVDIEFQGETEEEDIVTLAGDATIYLTVSGDFDK